MRLCELWEAGCRITALSVLCKVSDPLARPVARLPDPMIRPIPTLHGTALAVSALLIATAALTFDAGRTACQSHAAPSAHVTRAAQ